MTAMTTVTAMTTAAVHERYMRIAIEEAQRAADEGNVGVGSVIVLGGELIARGRNLVPTTNDPTAHAESVALREASVALGTDDMAGATMYTTFEPCPMCCGAIMNANIARLVMGGRPTAEQTMWGDYTLERLLEMCGWDDPHRSHNGRPGGRVLVYPPAVAVLASQNLSHLQATAYHRDIISSTHSIHPKSFTYRREGQGYPY